MTEATAPGKLMLVGEYAVLDGAPAIVAACGVRARANVIAIAGHESQFFDAASGQAFFFAIDDQAGLQWIDSGPGSNGTILEAVIAACLEHSLLFSDGPAFRVSMNTDEFFRQRDQEWTKLGLGSSSAVLVALVGALCAELKVKMTTAQLLKVCYGAHRRFQGGAGSGADIASAVYGRVVQIRPTADAPEVICGDWPGGLQALPVWSGQSASTPELLKRFESFRNDNPDDYRHHRGRLKALAEQSCAAWSEQSIIDILNSISSYDDALRALDADGLIGIDTDSHKQLREIAEGHGAVYKISGAGGGDFGIALSDSERVLDELREEYQKQKFLLLESRFADQGLSVS